MDQETVINYVVITIVVGALAIGLLSMLFGRIVDTYDALRAWWANGMEVQRNRYEQRAALYGLRDMSTYNDVLDLEENEREQRSYAMEHDREPSGTEDREPVPDLVEQLGTLDDDALLDILARLRSTDGDYRFAESRIAKFIPGRVEDRLAQVRDARDTAPPPPPSRQLRVRDTGGERLIPMDV